MLCPLLMALCFTPSFKYCNVIHIPEGKRPLGRPRRRWEDNIKIDFQEVGGGRGDWRALVSTLRDFRFP